MTDRGGIALTIVMEGTLQAVVMGLQKECAERYDWLVKEYTDLAFTFMTSFLDYMDYDALEKDSPIIVWDFQSLSVMLHMCFSFMITNKNRDMHVCKYHKKAFVASQKGNEFHSQKCKNQFNVYKSRGRKKENKRND